MFLALPSDLSPEDLLLNKIALYGVIYTGVFYGIAMTLCVSCLYHLQSLPVETLQRNPPSFRRWVKIYVMFLIVVGTTSMTLRGISVEKAYIHNSHHPGGPAIFLWKNPDTSKAVRAVCFVLLQWASDGLMLWRCVTFFSAVTSFAVYIMVIAVLLSSINVGFSIMWLVSYLSPGIISQFFQTFLPTYRFYALFLHTGTALAIIAKLLHHRRVMVKTFGPGHGAFYLDAISILVESAAVMVVYNLVFLIPAVLQHPLASFGRQVGPMIQIIPPLMIIQRVAQGTDSVREIQASEVAISYASRIEFTSRTPQGLRAVIQSTDSNVRGEEPEVDGSVELE